MGSIQEKRLDSWDEFDNIIRRRAHRTFVYRGHSDASWQLESSLFRVFSEAFEITRLTGAPGKKINRNGHERLAINKFRANGHLYLSHLPKADDALGWLSIMQHFGAPTRMLDFTFSPYVAAYFALESGVEDAAIYSLKHSVFREVDSVFFKEKDLNERYKNLLQAEEEENAGDFLYVYEPLFTNQRLMSQQGLFVIPSSNYKSHESIIDLYDLKKDEMMKYIIPKQMRREGLKRLEKMNVTASMLFPGLEGFCKSLKYQCLYQLGMLQRIGECDTF